MKNETNFENLQITKDQVLDELTAKYIYGGDLTIKTPIVVIPKFPIIQCIVCFPACAFTTTPVIGG